MATEYRAPLVLERGPLRYDFDIKKETWSLNIWNGVYCRDANKAFTQHGNKTETLSKLFFNKDNFKIAEIFGTDANGFDVDQLYLFKNTNAVVMETRIAPRAVYEEKGVVLGGRFEYPIWNKKGRIGVRASVPFRMVRIERDDEAECTTLPIQDQVVDGDQTFIRGFNGNGIALTGVSRYKVSLINRLKYFNTNGEILCGLNLRNSLRANNVTLFDNQYALADVSQSTGIDTPFVVMKGDVPGNASGNGGCCSKASSCCPSQRDLTGPPFGGPTGVTTGTATILLPIPTPAGSSSDEANVGMGSQAHMIGQVRFGENIANSATRIKALPADGNIDSGVGYSFQRGTNYANLPLQASYDDLWLSQVARGDATGFSTGDSLGANQDGQPFALNAFIQNLLGSNYLTDPYCWLKDSCGIALQSNKRIGVGDIDVDGFYEHTFNDQWRGELMLGVRFPTSTQNKQCQNPFAVSLGNGGHFELKLGAMGVWMPLSWMNIKLDLMYSFVLQKREKLPAAFKGSSIKGFGPCADADVDWGYFLGHLDFNFFYCKADLSTTIGYELYYKTKDSICFKCGTTKCHCLGQVWALADGTPITCNTPSAVVRAGNPSFQDFAMGLDSCAAAQNSERIAHRVRGETHWRATQCLSLYMGGAYTFAGKNIPQESDIYAGLTVYY